MSYEDLCTRDAGLYTCGQGSGPCSLPCVRATTTHEVSAVTITTAKTPFLSSLLISLRYKSVKGVFYIRTDISIGGDCLIDVSAEVR